MGSETLVRETEEKLRKTGAFVQLGPHLFLHSTTKILCKAVGRKKISMKIYHPLMAKLPSHMKDDMFAQYHFMVKDESQWSGHYRHVKKDSEYNYTVIEPNESFVSVVPSMKTWICKGCLRTCFGEDVSSRDKQYLDHMKNSIGCMGNGMIVCRGVVCIQTPTTFFVLADDNTRPLMRPIPHPLPQGLRGRIKADLGSKEKKEKTLVDEIEKENQEKMRQLVGEEKELGEERSPKKRRRTAEEVFKSSKTPESYTRAPLVEVVIDFSDEETQEAQPAEELQLKEPLDASHLGLQEIISEAVKENVNQSSSYDSTATPISLEFLLALVDKDSSAAKRELPTVMLKFLRYEIINSGAKGDIVDVQLHHLPAELIVSNKERTLMMNARLVRHVGETLSFTVSITMFIEDGKDVSAELYEASEIPLEKVCSLLKVLSVAVATVLTRSSEGEPIGCVRLKDVVFHCLRTVEVEDKMCWSLIKNFFEQQLEH